MNIEGKITASDGTCGLIREMFLLAIGSITHFNPRYHCVRFSRNSDGASPVRRGPLDGRRRRSPGKRARLRHVAHRAGRQTVRPTRKIRRGSELLERIPSQRHEPQKARSAVYFLMTSRISPICISIRRRCN